MTISPSTTPSTGARFIDHDSDPVIEVYKRDIDRTLLRANLAKSPEERVVSLIALQQLAEEARSAGRVARGQR